METSNAPSADPIAVLAESPDWRHRRRAALALGRERPTAAYSALIAALGDRDPDVRHAAVMALGELGDDRAVEALGRPVLLEDPFVNIRWATVRAIGRLGDLSASKAVAKALDDPEWVVRNQALLVMSEFIRQIPGSIDGDQIKSLIRLLVITDDEVHSLVVEALARRRSRGLDEMVEALHGPSPVVRAGVAEALGLSRDPRAVPPLVDAIHDPVGAVRREACRGLGRLADQRAVEPLIVALGDADSTVARAAVDALGAIGTAAATPLCAALRRTTPKLHRRNIIIALGAIGDPSAIIPLLNNLSSTYYVVRSATISALSKYGHEVVDDLMSMVQTSSVPIDSLIREIRQQSTKRLRLRAIRALGEIKNARATRPLRRLLGERDPEISATTQKALSQIGCAAWARHGAVIALGYIADARAVPAIIGALEDDSEYVRAEAARSIAKIGDDSAVPTLIYVLESDEDQVVRREAASALRSLAVQTPDVAEAFRTALGDDSWEVRAEAARGLGRIDDAASVETLIAALSDESYTVTTSASHALANLGELALPRLLAIAGGPDTPRRAAAIEALRQAAARELRPDIEALTDSSEEERRDIANRLRSVLLP